MKSSGRHSAGRALPPRAAIYGGGALLVGAVIVAVGVSVSHSDSRPTAGSSGPGSGQSSTARSTANTVAKSAATSGSATQPATTGTTRTVAAPGAIPALSNGPTGPAHSDAPSPAAAGPPVEVRIPAIGVDSRLQDLGLLSDGSLEPPTQWQVAGWYADGVRPGDVGPAVIAGHVDSTNGPAVFYRLRALKPGDAVYVVRKDGTTVHFTVSRTDEYAKNKFPTQAVYGPTPVPTLRLVTCTGDFDFKAKSYVDNLVVTAYVA